MIRKFIQRYTGFLRNLKLVYVLNNLFSRGKLIRNKELYEKYGIKKSIFSSIGSQDFKVRSDDIPWIDKSDAIDSLSEKKGYDEFEGEIQGQMGQFISEGYMILKSFFSKEEVTKHNEIIDKLINEGTISFNYTQKKINQVQEQSDYIRNQFFKNEKLLRIFNFIMGKKVIPFHSIHFMEGSEQRAHSDSIHMSTEPQGYLIAAWIALESTDKDNGPLFYYPGSHKLPYVNCIDYESGNGKWLIGGKYHKYEDKIEEILGESVFEKKYFYAEPGDVLIWHANLLHGGDPIQKSGRTRKSMVAHYFCEDVICYHEITQRPAILDVG